MKTAWPHFCFLSILRPQRVVAERIWNVFRLSGNVKAQKCMAVCLLYLWVHLSKSYQGSGSRWIHQQGRIPPRGESHENQVPMKQQRFYLFSWQVEFPGFFLLVLLSLSHHPPPKWNTKAGRCALRGTETWLTLSSLIHFGWPLRLAPSRRWAAL